MTNPLRADIDDLHQYNYAPMDGDSYIYPNPFNNPYYGTNFTSNNANVTAKDEKRRSHSAESRPLKMQYAPEVCNADMSRPTTASSQTHIVNPALISLNTQEHFDLQTHPTQPLFHTSPLMSRYHPREVSDSAFNTTFSHSHQSPPSSTSPPSHSSLHHNHSLSAINNNNKWENPLLSEKNSYCTDIKHNNNNNLMLEQEEELAATIEKEECAKKIILLPFSQTLPFTHKKQISLASLTAMSAHGQMDQSKRDYINNVEKNNETYSGSKDTEMNEIQNRSNSESNEIEDAIVVSKPLKGPVLAVQINSSNSNSSLAGSSSESPCHGRQRKLHSWRKTGGICDSLWLSITYALADFKRRPRNMVIGIIAVFLLVFFTGMIIAGITKTPYIILRLSEETMGEIDVLFTASGGNTFLNYTSFEPLVEHSSDVRGGAPRWVYRASFAPDKYNTNQAQYTNNSINSTAVNVLVIDDAQERAIGLGRGWPYRPIGYGEAHVYDPVVEFTHLRTNRGDRFGIDVDLNDVSESGQFGNLNFVIQRPPMPDITNITSVLLWMFFVTNNITENEVNLLNITNAHLMVTLVDGIIDSFGKYPSVYGNPVIMDSHRLFQYAIDQSALYGSNVFTPRNNYSFFTPAEMLQLPPELPVTFRIADYAMMIAVVLNDRYNMYYGTTSHRNREMTRKTNSMFTAIGIDYDASLTFPLTVHMDTFDSFKALLIAMFIVVVIGIVVLAAILMFTLLRINSEEKQFELAMFRAQGMPQQRLTFVLLSQTLFFTLPGVILGILLAWIANIVMEEALRKFTLAPARYVDMPIAAAVVSVVLGCALPLLATYGPAQRALHGNLRDALDIYRQAQNEAHVVKIKLAQLGVTPWQTVLGAFLVVVGFMVYYLVPYSFINNDLLLFFALLDVVLLAMVVGLCMILYVVEPYLSKLILFCMLWRNERKLHTLIVKNMQSHGERNSKAFIMFLLTIATLTAAGVMFTQLSEVTAQLSELTAGAPVMITTSTFNVPLNQSALDAYLQSNPAALASVDSWAYSSFPLSWYPQIQTRTTISNSITSQSGIQLRTISRSFMASTYDKFNMISEVQSGYSYAKTRDKKRDVVRSLYDEKPPSNSIPISSYSPIGVGYNEEALPNLTSKLTYRIPAIIGVAVKDVLGSDTHSMISLQYTYSISNGDKVQTMFQLEPRALMTRVAGFPTISKMTAGFSSSSLFVAEDDFRQLLNPISLDFQENANVTLSNNSIEEIVQQTLFISLKKGTSRRQREALVNGLTPLLDRVFHTTTDTEEIKEQMNTVQKLIMGFFYVTAVVCIILCAFMLWVTFIANVQLHAWTFGVLRSLGFNLPQLVRGAIYEALTIVLSAFIIGIVIGVCVGLTLSAQLATYLMLPFGFPFPYILVIVMFAMALVAAVAGSAAPFISLRSRSISEVLRGI